MKLWIDDIRFPPGPPGSYVWIKSVNQAKAKIIKYPNKIELIAEQDGYINIDAYKTGIAGVTLGIGRNKTSDSQF